MYLLQAGKASIQQMLLLLAMALAPAYALAAFSPSPRAAMQMSQAIETLPWHVDVLGRLPERVQKSWDHDGGTLFNDTLKLLSHIQVKMMVDVVLVGFDGTGGGGVLLMPEEILRHLKALPLDLPSAAIEPDEKVLVTKPHVQWRARWSTALVSQHVNAALKEAIDHARGANNSAVRVPHKVVDDIIAADFEAADAAFTVVLLNPNHTGDTYLYSYDTPGTSESYPSCGGGHWHSPSKPYMWVDLGAGPLNYGVGVTGPGHVTQHSVPRPALLGLPGRKTVSSRGTMLPAELAALVWSVSLHLLWPPMQHMHVEPTAPAVRVAVMHIHDTLAPPALPLDLKALQDLLAPLLLPSQNVSVLSATLGFADCKACVSAYSSALRWRTVRAASARVSAYTARTLSSAALYAAMQESKDDILKAAGVLTLPHTHRVVPVFLLDLHTDESLLLDGAVRSMAFSDLGLVVKTRAVEVDELAGWASCDGKRAHIDPEHVLRDVLATVLTTGWGLAPTSSFMTPASGAGVDHLWSVGPTPFGPLSHLTVLPVQLAALPLRNLALAAINESVTRAEVVLRGLVHLSPTDSMTAAALKPVRSLIHQRINLLQYKLTEAAKRLGMGKAAAALTYALSSRHEAKALEELAFRIQRSLDVKLECASSTLNANLLWVMPAMAMMVWVVAVIARWGITEMVHAKQS